MANDKVIRYAKSAPVYNLKEVPDFKKIGNLKKSDLGSSVAKNNRNYKIASGINEQMSRNREIRIRDEYLTKFNSVEKHVEFPWGVFIIFLIIDIIDIIMAIFVITSPFWSIFLVAVVLPFQIWYIKKREKEYSDAGIDFNLTAAQTSELKRYSSKIQSINREAASLLKAGKIEEAAMTAGAAKRVLPKNLKFLTILFEKIPWINLLPINSLLIILSYYDNIATVKALNDGIKLIASRMSFNTTRKYTNIATGRSGKK